MSGGFACSGWALKPQPWLDRLAVTVLLRRISTLAKQAPTASSIPASLHHMLSRHSESFTVKTVRLELHTDESVWHS